MNDPIMNTPRVLETKKIQRDRKRNELNILNTDQGCSSQDAMVIETTSRDLTGSVPSKHDLSNFKG